MYSLKKTIDKVQALNKTMKKIFCIVIVILVKKSVSAQIYKYISNRAIVTKLNTDASDIHTIHRTASFTIDSVNKKIIVEDSSGTIVYKIVSSKLTKYDATGTERREFKCLDKKGSIQIINLVLFNEIIGKQIHLSGQFEITIGSLSYAYDLHKKNSN